MGDEELPAAHQAIRLAKQGRMPAQEMLEHLVAGKVVVPLSDPPLIEDGVIVSWHPATASKADGSQWLMAFTLKEQASAFMDGDPEYGFYMTVDARWALHMLPPEYGIVFNLHTDDVFQWNAAGLAKYKREVLGW